MDMGELLYNTGLVTLTDEEQEELNQDIIWCKEAGATRINPALIWANDGFESDWIIGCMFLPYESDFEDAGTYFYKDVIPMETGGLLLRDSDEFDYGVLKDLRVVLENRGVLCERDVLY